MTEVEGAYEEVWEGVSLGFVTLPGWHDGGGIMVRDSWALPTDSQRQSVDATALWLDQGQPQWLEEGWETSVELREVDVLREKGIEGRATA